MIIGGCCGIESEAADYKLVSPSSAARNVYIYIEVYEVYDVVDNPARIYELFCPAFLAETVVSPDNIRGISIRINTRCGTRHHIWTQRWFQHESNFLFPSSSRKNTYELQYNTVTFLVHFP